MSNRPQGTVAIVDYGMGNLFSVERACEHAGLTASITTSRQDILEAQAVILPGVGAFSDAMKMLIDLDLMPVLREVAASGKPLVGICLGMQLLMTESYEFGHHQGLDIIEGEVVKLPISNDGMRTIKVPQVGWRPIHLDSGGPGKCWSREISRPGQVSLLDGVRDGEFMYFVHSYYPVPADETVVVTTTQHGSLEFCSSLSAGQVFACQFHPERSGRAGLRIYRNLAKLISPAE